MIQNLIAAIATRLQDHFDSVQVLNDVETMPPAKLPAILILPGAFTIIPSDQDFLLEPRTKDVRQTVTKSDNTKTQTYSLNYLALPETVKAAVLKTDSNPEALTANTDFVVDYEKSTLTLLTDKVALNDQVLIGYTCAQSTVQREFEQEFVIHVYDHTLANVEKWASLTCGIVLSSISELLDSFNNQSTPYQEKLFTTVHQLRGIELLKGTPQPNGTSKNYELRFIASGELRIMRQLTELPAVKESIINENLG